jgi:hypothetical protein
MTIAEQLQRARAAHQAGRGHLQQGRRAEAGAAFAVALAAYEAALAADPLQGDAEWAAGVRNWHRGVRRARLTDGQVRDFYVQTVAYLRQQLGHDPNTSEDGSADLTRVVIPEGASLEQTQAYQQVCREQARAQSAAGASGGSPVVPSGSGPSDVPASRRQGTARRSSPRATRAGRTRNG